MLDLDLGAWLPHRRAAAAPIGLDLAETGLRLVQLEPGPERRIRAALALPYPEEREKLLAEPKALRAFLRHALAQGRFQGRRVVALAPRRDLKLMVLGFTAEEGGEEAALARLVEERTSQPLGECVVDYLPIRTGSERRSEHSGLVAVARRESLVQQLEALRRSGLAVEAVEIEPVAARRLVSWLDRDAQRCNALVLFAGRQSSDLTVLWGRRLILFRQLEFGEDSLVEGLAKGLDLGFDAAREVLLGYGFRDSPVEPGADEASGAISRTVAEILRPEFNRLAAQMNDAVVYTASRTRGASIDRVDLLGAFVRWPGIGELVQRLLSIPVRLVDPVRMLPRAEGAVLSVLEGDGAELAIASGLALRGWDDGA